LILSVSVDKPVSKPIVEEFDEPSPFLLVESNIHIGFHEIPRDLFDILCGIEFAVV
jgi:hypothetical protein